MIDAANKKAKQLNPGLRASIYYGAMWGLSGFYITFVSINLVQRGVSETQWGIISALRALTVFLVAPQITRFADKRRSRVKILRLLLILSAFTLLFFLLPLKVPGLTIFMVISAFFSAGTNPMGDGIVVRMVKKYQLEYGRLRLWGSLGFAVFGTLGGLLWDRIGYSYIYIAGFIGLLLVAWLTGLLEEPEEDAEPQVEVQVEINEVQKQDAEKSTPIIGDRKKLIGFLLGDVVLLLFFLAAFFRSASELMFFSFSGIYINALTNSAFFAGLINGGAAILEIPVMLYSQKIIRRFNLQSVIVFGFFIQTVGMIIFSFTEDPWLMFLGSALRNAGFAFYFVAAVQFIDSRAAAGYSTTFQGLLSSISWGLAPLIFSPLAGVIYQQWSPRWVFIMSTLFSVVSMIVMVPVILKLRREKMKEKEASSI